MLTYLRLQILKFKKEPKENRFLLKTGLKERCYLQCRLMKLEPTYATVRLLASKFLMFAKIVLLKF
jgi:hypothetical protein